MSCGGTPSSITVTMALWTGKSTTTALYVRLIDAIDMSKVKFVRATLQVESPSGAFQGKAGYRYTNDKVTYDTAVDLTSYQVNGGIIYGAWVDVTASAKLFAEFGVQTLNQSGTQVEMALATLRIDFREN